MSLVNLGILASGNQLTAVLRTGDNIFENTRIIGLKHNSILLSMVDSLFTESGTAPSELELVACTRGPGSFTALRIVMATAKGLCAPHNLPLIALPTLDLWGSFYSHFDGIVVPVIDGRQIRYYTRFYESGSPVSEHLDLSGDAIEKRITDLGRVLVCGPDQQPFSRPGIPGRHLAGNTELPGSWLLRQARFKFEEEGNGPMDIGPLYCRRSDAEIGAAAEIPVKPDSGVRL